MQESVTLGAVDCNSIFVKWALVVLQVKGVLYSNEMASEVEHNGTHWALKCWQQRREWERRVCKHASHEDVSWELGEVPEPAAASNQGHWHALETTVFGFAAERKHSLSLHYNASIAVQV